MASSSMKARGYGSTWTQIENKKFEKALAYYDKDAPDRWQNIAKAIGGNKSTEEIKRHYDLLLQDLYHIEIGLVPIPKYKSGNGSNEEQRYSCILNSSEHEPERGLSISVLRSFSS